MLEMDVQDERDCQLPIISRTFPGYSFDHNSSSSSQSLFRQRHLQENRKKHAANDAQLIMLETFIVHIYN